MAAYLQEIPMPEGSKCYVGKNVTDIQPSFQKLGFTNMKITKITQKGLTVKDGQVLNIRINGRDGFDMCEWYPVNSDIVIEYYEPQTEEEVAAVRVRSGCQIPLNIT